MTTADAIGYAATALIIATFFIHAISRLRSARQHEQRAPKQTKALQNADHDSEDKENPDA